MLGKCCRNVLNFGEDKANLGEILQWKILPTMRVSLEIAWCLLSRQQQDGTSPRTSKYQVERVNQRLLVDPKSDPSVSKVVQQTYVCVQLYHEGSSTQAILSKTTLQPMWNDTT